LALKVILLPRTLLVFVSEIGYQLCAPVDISEIDKVGSDLDAVSQVAYLRGWKYSE
jgi:hypothetical protein